MTCTCERCDKKFKLKDSPDDAFCKECVDYYESPEYADSLMERTRAAVAMCNARDPWGSRKMGVYAFLSIFHPTMTNKQKWNVMRAVED